MPDAKDNAKMTGDTHLPDVESDDLSVQEGTTGAGVEGTPSGRRRPGDGHPPRPRHQQSWRPQGQGR